MDLVLIWSVNVSLKSVFLDPHCRHIEPTGSSGFTSMSEHES